MTEENQEQNEKVGTDGPELEETGDMQMPIHASPKQSTSAEADEYPWKPQAGHASAAGMLLGRDAKPSDDDVEEKRGRSALNLVLLLLIVGVAGGAFATLQHTDGFYSETGIGLAGIIDLKEELARHQEQEFTYEELKKKKRFGTLTMASEPTEVKICADKSTLNRINLSEESKAKLGKCPRPNARGEAMFQLGTSPGKIEGIDISHSLSLVGQREGFQDFPMHIGTHLWPVNQGKDAQYKRAFKMAEIECNRWMSEDTLFGDVAFYSYVHCEGYTRGVAKKNEAGRSAKPCRCEPEVVEPKNKSKKKR